jgi:transposase-like protein
MQYTTNTSLVSTLRVLCMRMQLLVRMSFLVLALSGRAPESVAGWVVWPPCVYVVSCCCREGVSSRWTSPRGTRKSFAGGAVVRTYVRQTWRVPVLRSVALSVLWVAGGQVGPIWIVCLPWANWVWQGVGLRWAGLARQPEWRLVRWAGRLSERLLLWVYVGLALAEGVARLEQIGAEKPLLKHTPWLCAGASVTVRRDAERGGYSAELDGRFTLHVRDDHSFRLRLMVLFLRLLEDPTTHRGSRRTRDGRTPLVRQQYLAGVLGIPQPDISRWERYWQEADWRRLLSQKAPEVLTFELQQRIIETWARWPDWGREAVHRFLVGQGVAVTESQVRQAAHESGWQIVRQEMARLCVQRGEELRLREGWLIGDLLAQVQTLLEKLEAGSGLTTEEHLELKGWLAAASEAGLPAQAPGKAAPWLRRLEQVFFAPWIEEAIEGVCCPECGSSHVGRKGRAPRRKKFVAAHGQVQEVDVYRYRCHNRMCPRKSFTVYPAGLVPYSSQRLEVHVLALQMYAWGYSTYRRTGQALGVASGTVYRWVSAFGCQLLPVAALFGVVCSSGVVGVDEKWVQAPKNDKPAGERRKWMYVYLAVDVYTYDLLHIAIYPRNTAESTEAFLLALRAKGYHPRVVVTDLRQEYGPAIDRVFPQAQHHECLFHASQALHRQLADIYGQDALRHNTQVATLRQTLDGALQARTKRTAQRRYDQLMRQRESWLQQQPALAGVFASLEAHWPRLINGIESELIPRTNNTVELVIRRFDQHYQNFCGFDSLESANRFLAVFEKVYRFTPFSDDAQPSIRGKSPLELAGYHIANLPMTTACRGYAVIPPPTPEGSVPNV